jgi:hypothetical protein
VDINFGESNFVQDNWLLEAVTFEIIQFSFVVIHNTAWLLGKYMFSNMLGPAMDKYLNHYQEDVFVPQPIFGSLLRDHFVVDYRNTHDPIHDVEHNSLLFQFAGELFYKGQGCSEFNPRTVPPLNIRESYLAISPEAAECIAEQVSKSKVGSFEVNQRNLELMFGDGTTHPVTTSSIAMDIFARKLGSNQPLTIKLGYKDMKVKF